MGLSINQQKNLEEKLCSKDFRNPMKSTQNLCQHNCLLPLSIHTYPGVSMSCQSLSLENPPLCSGVHYPVSLADWSPDKNSGGNKVSIAIYVFK